MTRAEAERFFDHRADAWTRRDLEALSSGHTDDCVLESPIAGTVRGRAAIENTYRSFFTSFPDVAADNRELVVEDGRVVQTLTFSGTNTGGFMGMPPTGKRFSFAAVVICHFRDGKVAHERRIYDFTGFLLEIGVLKAKPN